MKNLLAPITKQNWSWLAIADRLWIGGVVVGCASGTFILSLTIQKNFFVTLGAFCVAGYGSASVMTRYYDDKWKKDKKFHS